MYIRPDHAEKNLYTLHNFIRSNPFGILTTAIKSESAEHLIQSSHFPFLLDTATTIATDGTEAPGILRGHFARNNPQARALMEAQTKAHEARKRQGQDIAPHDVELDDEVLVLFNGPFHHYVTPKFYTETKPQTGEVVPTWNYSAVQAYGKARIFSDPSSDACNAYLRRQIEDLTRFCEGEIMGYAVDGETGSGKEKAWSVDDAPRSYVEEKMKSIIGIEIRLEKLEGRYKMSQESGLGDREGIVRGFESLGTEAGNGIAKAVKERGQMKDQEK